MRHRSSSSKCLVVMASMAVLAVGFPSNGMGRSASTMTTGGSPAPQLSLSVVGSHRYSISIDASGREVLLSANGPGGLASYRMAGKVTRNHLEARIGSRGRIDVDFRPSGSLTRRVPPGRCEGKPRVTRFGAFVGTIRFRGEHGYTDVDVDRAEGSVNVPRGWKCKGKPRRPANEECSVEDGADEVIDLTALDAGRGRYFSAFTQRSAGEPSTTMFFAASVEQRGQMEVSRGIFVDGTEDAFAFDPGLGFATVSPSSPFDGSATFRRYPDRSTTWRGDLTVSLPGAPNTRLVGKAFHAQLTRPAPQPSVVCVAYLAARRLLEMRP